MWTIVGGALGFIAFIVAMVCLDLRDLKRAKKKLTSDTPPPACKKDDFIEL
jgi:hypothetical protein